MDDITPSAPFRDNPLLAELESLKRQLETSKVNQRYVCDRRDFLEQELKTQERRHKEQLRRGAVMRFVMKAILCLLYVFWFVAGAALVMLPVYFCVRLHADLSWLWLTVLGVVLLGAELVHLREVSS